MTDTKILAAQITADAFNYSIQYSRMLEMADVLEIAKSFEMLADVEHRWNDVVLLFGDFRSEYEETKNEEAGKIMREIEKLLSIEAERRRQKEADKEYESYLSSLGYREYDDPRDEPFWKR